MRKRSEAATTKKMPDEKGDVTQFKNSGYKCSVCHGIQYEAPGGLVCKKGHGGAPPLTAEEIAPFEFDSANAAKESRMSDDFERIVETVLVAEPWEEYKRLEKALRVGEGRSDHGTVNKALDEAEGNARLAHRLWVTATVERKRWELQNEVIFAVMRSNANEVLTREKTMGIRPKQITDADIDSCCGRLYPDEYAAQEVRKAKVKGMEDSMKNLAEVWMRRCSSLSTMLSKQR